MAKRVLVNVEFRDAYNPKKIYKQGEFVEFSDDRVKEILAIDKNFITPVGNVEEEVVKSKQPKVPKEPNPTGQMLADLDDDKSQKNKSKATKKQPKDNKTAVIENPSKDGTIEPIE